MTPYVAVHFGFGLESISNPLSVSTLMGDSIMARKIYRGCAVSILHRETMVD